MFLGMDVSKNKIDVALIREQDNVESGKKAKPLHKVFANTPTGHQELIVWLKGQTALPVHVCLEATGTYGHALALALIQAEHKVSLVNPALIKAFGQSQLSRTKTDKVDAKLIAAYCQMHRPPVWNPPSPEVSELQALVRRLEALQEMHQMEDNRLQAGVFSESVVRSLQEHLAYLTEQIQQTKKQITDHLDNHPRLKQQKDLLLSIPGIGETTVAVLLAELGDTSVFQNAGQVAAFAGLIPKIRQSGSSVRFRSCLSKVGSWRLRRALYFPAMVSLRFNPLVRALGERLSEKGKSKMLIIGAAMRKLLYLVYGVLKSGKPFDPDFATPIP